MYAAKPFPNILHAILLATILFAVQVFLGTGIAIFSMILRAHEFMKDPAVMGILIAVSFSGDFSSSMESGSRYSFHL
jgi:hypothetical protein